MFDEQLIIIIQIYLIGVKHATMEMKCMMIFLRYSQYNFDKEYFRQLFCFRFVFANEHVPIIDCILALFMTDAM